MERRAGSIVRRAVSDDANPESAAELLCCFLRRLNNVISVNDTRLLESQCRHNAVLKSEL